MAFVDFYYLLDGYDFYEFVLPFLLVFSIIFAILEKTNIFSKKDPTDKNNVIPNTNVNLVVSIVIAFIVIANTEIVWIINNYLSKMALFLIILVIFLLSVGVISGRTVESGENSWWIFVIAGIAVVWALGPTLGFELPYWIESNFLQSGLIVFLVIIILIIKYFRSPSGNPRPGGRNP